MFDSCRNFLFVEGAHVVESAHPYEAKAGPLPLLFVFLVLKLVRSDHSCHMVIHPELILV